MKLIVRKNQADKKGMFGGNKGVNFSLEYYVSLTQEEQELIEKYKLENAVLMTTEDGGDTTIQDMIDGEAFTTQDIGVLQNIEDSAISVCENLRIYIDVLRSFGGEYWLDFRSDGVYDENGEKIR